MDDNANHMRDMKYRLRKHTTEHINYNGVPKTIGLVGAVMSGFIFGNWYGDDPLNNGGELTVGITVNGKREWFNLATLIALARTSALKAESFEAETEDAPTDG